MDNVDRQRRHDEQWQHEVLNGMSRMLDVLHDISDGISRQADALSNLQLDAQSPDRDSEPLLLSVKDLAETLGISPGTVYGLRATGHGPPITKIGTRVFFQRDDVDTWLRERREESTSTRPWRQSYLPGGIGSGLPRSSEPTQRDYCTGSHSEPMAASQYSGRAICRVCRDDVLVNRDGRLRKHHPRSW